MLTFITYNLKKVKQLSTMDTRKVKHTVLLKIALLIALLLAIPRTLSLFDITKKLVDSFTEVSMPDISIRFIFMFLMAFIALEYNSNYKSLYSHFSIVLRTSLTVVFNAVSFLGLVQLFVFIYPLVTQQVLSDSEIGFTYFVYFVILIVGIFIAQILRDQIVHHKDLIENEQLKQQNLQKELTALKNQVNPHFLFNSLNSLNAIVRDNKDATTFIKNLSFMYRYILQSGEIDLVSLEEELRFLNSYAHLIKTRYQDRFIIEMDIEEKYLETEIPPLALQLLVENAVKHNEISEKKPLQVSVFSEDEHIIVKNDIQPRTAFVESTGNGLLNLDKRYFLLKKQHIKISNDENVFCVKLPLSL